MAAGVLSSSPGEFVLFRRKPMTNVLPRVFHLPLKN
jgi:hypothetical protein